MRRALTLVAMVVTAGSAWAAPGKLTCETFKQRLVDAIHTDGDRVAVPTRYSLAFQEKGNPHLRYEFGGIVGLKGDLNCVENDGFQSFDANADLQDVPVEEAAHRMARLLALSAAATCATDPSTGSACQKRVNDMYGPAIKEFMTAKDRGEEHPSGDKTSDISLGSQAELTIISGGMSFSLFSNMDRKPEDLE